MAWDDVAGKAAGNNGDKYVVLQVVLTENYLALVQAQLVLLICNQKLINKRPKDTGFHDLNNIFWLQGFSWRR